MKIIKMLILAHLLSVSFIVSREWTWLYQKKFTKNESTLNEKLNKDIQFRKSGIPEFSQLIFSWNAFRPEKGFYRFFVRVRVKNTWGPWHKMADWGCNVARSYENRNKVINSSFLYVRLEAEQHADAFSIKVEPMKGANLGLLKGFSVSTSNFKRFATEIGDKSLGSLPTVQVSGVPKKSQFFVNHPDNHSMCSPTSCCMLASYIVNKDLDPLEFATNSYDNGLGQYGSWAFNVAHAFDQCKGRAWFSAARFNSFKELHECLDRKVPVVVSVRGYLKGAPKVYNNGHLLVVIGWDAKKQQVICHDPAFKRKNKLVARYSLPCFLNAWERSRRLVYLAEPVRKF